MPAPTRLRPLFYLASASATTAGGIYLYSSLRPPRHAPHANLDSTSFTPWPLAATQRVSATNSILTLLAPASTASARSDEQTRRKEDGGEGDSALVPARTPYDVLFAAGPWSVEAKHPLLMVSREYTPLPPFPPLVPPPSSSPSSDSSSPAPSLDLLIRADGETSRFLSGLPAAAAAAAGEGPSSVVALRGPHSTFTLPPDTKEVLFLAGGTGVAPALQVAWALALRGARMDKNPTSSRSAAPGTGRQDPAAAPEMTLLFASRTRDDVQGGVSDASLLPGRGWWGWRTAADMTEQGQEQGPIVARIAALQAMLRLRVAYFVDAEGTAITPGYLRGILARRRHPGWPEKEPEEGPRVLLVSGPPGFVAHFAGRKVWAEGREEQGPLGGVLGQMRREGRLEGWTVWKL